MLCSLKQAFPVLKGGHSDVLNILGLHCVDRFGAKELFLEGFALQMEMLVTELVEPSSPRSFEAKSLQIVTLELIAMRVPSWWLTAILTLFSTIDRIDAPCPIHIEACQRA